MGSIKRNPITRRYQNPYGETLKKRFLDLLLYGIGYHKDVLDYSHAPSDFMYPEPQKKKLIQKEPKITWINHSTFLVECSGYCFLTDPIFSERCSPFSFLGPKRKHSPGLSIEKLPSIDFVLISHDHYDHLDKASVLALNKKNPQLQWIVPHKVGKWFKKLNIHNVVEFNWWDEHILFDHEVKITAVPAQHFSGRTLFGGNRTLWLGYVVEFLTENKSVYFAGDTGYNPVHFKQIGEKFEMLDLSLIPIGAYLPKRFMQSIHVCPKEAVQIHQDVNSKLSVASHFKTFSLALEQLDQPPFDLFCAIEEAQLDHNHFCVLQPGQSINW